MNYEIKSFDRITGSALVRFWTDAYPDGLHYNVDIPLKDGAYISGADLEAHIQCFAPVGQIDRLVSLAAIDASAIEVLIPPQPEPPAKTPEQLAEEARNAAKKTRAEYVSGIAVTTASGRTFDGDETSQNRMERAIGSLTRMNALLAAGTPLTLPAESAAVYQIVNGEYRMLWVLADNTPVQVTAAELTEALALAGAAQSAVWVL